MPVKKPVKKVAKKVTKPATTKHAGGRPRKELDTDMVIELAKMQCTDEEIARVLKVTPQTIVNRKKTDSEFAEALARGRELGKVSIRKAQFDMLQNGSDRQKATMAVWLGKQILSQADSVNQIHKGGITVSLHPDDMNL